MSPDPHHPAQNRVTPLGDVVAASLRCAWMGNRGVLHDAVSASRRQVVRRGQARAWITCTLEDRGYDVQQWTPGHYTPLFLHDEAVALAAGTFVLHDEGPATVVGDALHPWTTHGYGDPVARPRAGRAVVITPPTSVEVLRRGWPVQLGVG